MVRTSALVGIALLAGCLTDRSYTHKAYAPDAIYHDQITACTTLRSCIPLCVDVFQLTTTDEVIACKITSRDPGGVELVVRYIAHSPDDGSTDDDSWDDGSWDDGSWDDGSCNDDGSCDDGSDSGSDTGSDDGSDSGSDDGSTLAAAPSQAVRITPDRLTK